MTVPAEKGQGLEKASSAWSPDLADAYEARNYGPGLAGFAMRSSHALVERDFGSEAHFTRVLEVGAGSGIHLRYVRHRFDEYIMSDGNQTMLDQISQADADNDGRNVVASLQDATKLDLADGSVDRLIATHVLEHLYRPHEVLQEWMRVVRPGGIISLVLPCDPGLAWRFGRHLGPRRRAESEGIAYDYLMALEHVNSIGNLIAIIRHHAAIRRERWWPLGLPSTDLNLIYAVNITKPPR